MNILILNWRDIKNPASGGAELLTHELSKGWVKKGIKVTQFSPLFKKAKAYETIDGINFVRAGTWWAVHLHAFFYYLGNRDKFDVIIDEVHWFPFFARVYARNKTIALTCERATKLFPTIFPPVISHVFQLLERLYFLIYRDVPTMTISESTKKDLIRAGINRKRITVLPMGISLPKSLKKYPKEKNPTFIYLGRLNKQKGIFDCIESFAIIKNHKSVISYKSSVISSPILWIVGSGLPDAEKKAKDLVKKYGLESNIKFFGFVTEAKKFELLARAHILLVPSAHEGWGLTVPEASSQKTPSIVYNVSGLRDIVESGTTGIIVKKNTPDALASEAVRLLGDKALYKRLQEEGFKKVKEMKWSNTVQKSLSVINNKI